MKNGAFSHFFVDANAVSHQITGINNNNVISGIFLDIHGHTKGFLQLLSYANVNVHYEAPGSTFTQFFGVNLKNEARRHFVDGLGTMHGLVYNAGSKALLTVDLPGSTSTTLTSINDNHQAVWFYNDAVGNTHGFLVTNVPSRSRRFNDRDTHRHNGCATEAGKGYVSCQLRLWFYHVARRTRPSNTEMVSIARLDRFSVRCDAMRCDAMRCDAMRCDAMRCDAMRCDAMRDVKRVRDASVRPHRADRFARTSSTADLDRNSS